MSQRVGSRFIEIKTTNGHITQNGMTVYIRWLRQQGFHISSQTDRHEARIPAAGSTKLEEGLLRYRRRCQDNDRE